tara:strand:+ start:45523 stop:45867 length:345 start_codon:yes stop_codon:yes gene_type:complete
MASLKNLEAALLTLQAQALKHYGAIEILINNPVGLAEHTDYADEIIKHAKALSECEEAYGSLQKHFVPKPPPVTQTEPRPVQEGAAVITPENSPTMKRTLQRVAKKKKKELKND